MATHRMLLISTGGTIAGEVAVDKKHPDYDIMSADAFADMIKDTKQYLEREIKDEIIIESHEFAEVDSSDIKPEHWIGLTNLIYEKYDNYDSFVITHGTNTLGYTCAALSFSILNPGKPIILTGSQVPGNMPGSDAKTNLENAIRLATWRRDALRGVLAVFGSHIITGTRVKKDTEFDYDAFKSFNSGSIGRIGRLIDLDIENLNRHKSYHVNGPYHEALDQSELRIENEFCTDIVSLTEFPGMDTEILLNLVTQLNIKGIIIRAFGAGDLSTGFRDVLEKLKTMEIPVVATTQAPNGNATLQVNEPGEYLKKHQLAIPAYDMSLESQTAKLAWLLAKKENNEISYKQLCDQMVADLRGEIKVIREN